MKYVATVEIEFETDGDPLEALHRVILAPTEDAVHYHIIEQPRELK